MKCFHSCGVSTGKLRMKSFYAFVSIMFSYVSNYVPQVLNVLEEFLDLGPGGGIDEVHYAPGFTLIGVEANFD